MSESYQLEKDFQDLPLYGENYLLSVPFNKKQKIKKLLAAVWEKEEPEKIYRSLLKIMQQAAKRKSPRLRKRDNSFKPEESWSAKNFYLICYGDHLKSKGGISPLKALSQFLQKYFNSQYFSQLTVHLLPIYCSPQKDKGFDVADPFKVNPQMGSWQEVEQIAQNFHLALDFVLNHLSKDSVWFQKFLADEPAFKDFFIAFDEADPRQMARLREIRRRYQKLIYRPRAHDPFVRVKKKNGQYTWVYMTFSHHQPDVNYANPLVFLKMSEVLLYYVLRGADTLRIDAVPYLWKEWGTSCVHHPKTHLLVELFRLVLQIVAPSVKLLSESMEPPEDSVRYLSTDKVKKAQMAYNFIPCGLIPFTLIHQDASRFQRALKYFQTPSQETVQAVVCGKTHDGSSFNACRPPKSVKGEAVLKEEEINQLAEFYAQRGKKELKRRSFLAKDDPYYLPADFARQFKKKHRQPIRFANYKTITDAQGKSSQIVYEAISTYASLFQGNPDQIVAALAMALPLRGIPFIYLTALFAVFNDYWLYFKTGNPRELNRGQLYLEDLEKKLKDKASLTHKVFYQMLALLKIRTANKAFHPQGEQRPVLTANKAIFSFLRLSPDRKEKVLILQNVSSRKQKIRINFKKRTGFKAPSFLTDLIAGQKIIPAKNLLSLTFKPYQILWLKF